MRKFLLSWDLLKWISCSKGEGISHGLCCSFPWSFPQPTTALNEAEPFHLPWQHPGQSSSAGAAAWLLAALRAHRELQSLWERTASRAGPQLTENLYGLTQAPNSLPAEAPLCYGIRQKMMRATPASVRELDLLPCPKQGPKCCQLPNHATKERKSLFPVCCY